jgi:hypothetical protein
MQSQLGLSKVADHADLPGARLLIKDPGEDERSADGKEKLSRHPLAGDDLSDEYNAMLAGETTTAPDDVVLLGSQYRDRTGASRW